MLTLRVLLGILAATGLAVAELASQSHPPYFPIRLLDLWTYGDTVTNWIEPGTINFALIDWRNHNLCRYDFRPEKKPNGFLESVAASQARLKAEADHAHQLGLLVYLNEYELEYPDFISRQTLFPASARESFMEQKLYEVFMECPWLDGYMITPTESKLGVTTPEELRAVAMGAYRGMKRAEGKLGQKRYLFVRSWLSAAALLHDVQRFFPITNDPQIAKDIIVVAKPGLGDFVMRRPLNPLFGSIQPHSTIVLWDVSVSEYRSLGWYPQGPAELWGYRLQQLAATPGVIGINIHTARLNEIPGFTPEQMFPRYKEGRIAYGFQGGVKWNSWHYLNLFTMNRLLRNPWLPPRQIYQEWATQVYGSKAANVMTQILLLSDDALYHGMLTFGVNLNNHSGFITNPDRPIEAMNHAIEYQLKLQPNLTPLFEINPDTVDRAVAEKQEAVELTVVMLELLKEHQSDFESGDYQSVKSDLMRMKSALEAYEFVQAGYFIYQLAIAHPSVVDRGYYVGLLQNMIQQAEVLYMSKPEFLHQKTERSFIYMTRAFRRELQARGFMSDHGGNPTR